MQTGDGVLELRRRGEDDFLILLDGRVIMTSAARRSEQALGRLACEAIAARRTPAVLIGGLGMGFTLRAALDALPARARVCVVELHPVVVEWCRGPLAPRSDGAVGDPRVRVEVGDVAEALASQDAPLWDAVVLDLFEGPRGPDRGHPLFGEAALARVHARLRPGGVFSLWSETHDATFEKRLVAAGFAVHRERPGRGGLRHVVYLGVREPGIRGDRPRGRAPRRRSSTG